MFGNIIMTTKTTHAQHADDDTGMSKGINPCNNPVIAPVTAPEPKLPTFCIPRLTLSSALLSVIAQRRPPAPAPMRAGFHQLLEGLVAGAATAAGPAPAVVVVGFFTGTMSLLKLGDGFNRLEEVVVKEEDGLVKELVLG